jgi:hypothetical protein
MIFRPNWTFRGSPNPKPGADCPLLVLVSRPKLRLVNVTFGFAQLLRLNRFKISTRNSDMILYVIGVRLKIEKSTEPSPGPSVED